MRSERTVSHHRASLRRPSVTEDQPFLAPNSEERVMARSRLSDWIVPPVIVPAVLLLFLLVVVVWRG
jgi:ABC-type uncharacterized transport system involved in gliding motility auxiliary subunit